jgi:hypothetical protein
MNRKVAVLMAGMLTATAIGQTQDTLDRLKRMRETYETELAKIDHRVNTKLQALQKRYLTSLEAMQQTMQNAGRLDPLLTIQSERKRFAAAKSVEEADIKTEPPELNQLQRGYGSSANVQEVTRAKQIVSLAGKYGKALDAMRKRLTKAGDIKSALKAREAGDALDIRAELDAARFVLADAAARTPPPAPEPQPQPRKVTPADLATKRRPVRQESDKRRIGKRYKVFCDALAEEDLEGTIACVDPRVVRKAGTEALRPFFVALSAMMKGARAAGISIEPGRIEVDEEAGRAKNIPRVRIFNDIKDGDPTYWVYVEDEWYVAVDGEEKEKEARQSRAEEARQKREESRL